MTPPPYPSHLAREHVLADGTRLMIRPIRPEDAASESAFVNSLSQRARYLRFMYTLKENTPEMLLRFTQIDYEREMALIALVGEGGRETQVAVARYAAYENRNGCEFAIVVADDWHGKGIATELLRRLIEVARSRRLERLEGIVLRENKGMLKLARQLGFDQHPVAEDQQLLRVTLDL